MLHPFLFSAESAGSLLMLRCSADIDSLLDVLKRFLSLCGWEQGAGREWSVESNYIQYILLLCRDITVWHSWAEMVLSIFCNFILNKHVRWSHAIGWQFWITESLFTVSKFNQFSAICLPLNLFSVCIARNKTQCVDLSPEGVNCLCV